MKKLPLTLALVLLAGIIVLIPKESLVNEMSKKNPASRISTLNKIIEQANRGNYFQVEEGVPMETQWEDPGMGVALSLIRLARRPLRPPFNQVNLEDIYYIEIFLTIICILLPFSSVFRHLPRWYDVIIPMFLLNCVVGRFLVFEWGQYIVSTLSVIWIVTALMNFFTAFQTGLSELRARRLLFLNALCVGVGVGVLGLFRRSVHMEGVLIIILGILILQLSPRITSAPTLGRPWKMAAGLILLFLLGTWIPRGVLKGLWKARDSHQVMKEVPRSPRHPFWHVLYIGLGYIDNEQNILWDDASGAARAKQISPTVPYGTDEFENLMRKIFIDEVKNHPSLLIKNLSVKIYELTSFGHHLPLLAVFLLLMFALLGTRHSSLGWMGLASLGVWSFSPLISIPGKFYSLSVRSASPLWIYILILMVLFDSAVRASLAALPWKKARRAIVISFLCFAVPAVLVIRIRRSVMAQPGVFLVTTTFANGRTTDQEIRVEKGRNTYKISLGKDPSELHALHLAPRHFFRSSFDIHPIVLIDRTEHDMNVKVSDMNAAWTARNAVIRNNDEATSFGPRSPDFELEWKAPPLKAAQLRLIIDRE